MSVLTPRTTSRFSVRIARARSRFTVSKLDVSWSIAPTRWISNTTSAHGSISNATSTARSAGGSSIGPPKTGSIARVAQTQRLKTYVQILPDGSRQKVRYDPRHDGPVSHRLTLLRRVKFLTKKASRPIRDRRAEKQLQVAQRMLFDFDSRFQVSRSPHTERRSLRGKTRARQQTNSAPRVRAQKEVRQAPPSQALAEPLVSLRPRDSHCHGTTLKPPHCPGALPAVTSTP